MNGRGFISLSLIITFCMMVILAIASFIEYAIIQAYPNYQIGIGPLILATLILIMMVITAGMLAEKYGKLS
jgi:hypothetical protein